MAILRVQCEPSDLPPPHMSAQREHAEALPDRRLSRARAASAGEMAAVAREEAREMIIRAVAVLARATA